MKAEKPKPNLPRLRERFREAGRAWRELCEQRGIDIYSDAAEGKMIGRGKARAPDDLKRAFDAFEEARLALGGGEA